ncbi:MAG: hypothetical protein O3A46_02595 [Candidatus Poribacteria bacterium]|nr:hypothetical protein [Candidatus Poribacteria bacterium]
MGEAILNFVDVLELPAQQPLAMVLIIKPDFVSAGVTESLKRLVKKCIW